MTTLATPVLREVRLYGALGRQFGRVFRLAVKTPHEAVVALCAVLPGFKRAFLGRDGRAAYHVFVGRGQQRRDIAADEAAHVVGATEPIRLVPVVAGAKRAGALQTIIGVVLIIAGTNGVPGATNLGVAMLVGGVIQLLSPQPKREEERQRPQSYAFDGPANNTEQGGPVPLVFGRVICGSTVVSQGLSSEERLVEDAAPLGPAITPPWDPRYPSLED